MLGAVSSGFGRSRVRLALMLGSQERGVLALAVEDPLSRVAVCPSLNTRDGGLTVKQAGNLKRVIQLSSGRAIQSRRDSAPVLII